VVVGCCCCCGGCCLTAVGFGAALVGAGKYKLVIFIDDFLEEEFVGKGKGREKWEKMEKHGEKKREKKRNWGGPT
jgi:hypothetical protein